MNNRHRISERGGYKIKVNKKDFNNNIYKTNNYFINSNNKDFNSAKLYKMNTYIQPLQSTKPTKNFDNHTFISSYANNGVINTKIIKCKNNSNSEEKIRKKNININIYDEQNHKDGNILEDLINNKYLKPILECQDIDEKLFNCNLKEPVKNSFNVSLNDFFNRKTKYFLNFKTPKLEISKIPRGLSINTHNFSNNNNSNQNRDNYYNNNANNDVIIQNHNNRTFESNNNNNHTNNYYNDIQMTNNYYNNNEINMVNFQSYNNNIVHFSSEGKKGRDYAYFDNNPLIYYSYEKNKNLFENKPNAYINNKNNNNIYNIHNIHYLNEENNLYNNNNNNIINYNKLNSPLNYYFKSQTYTQKKNRTNLDKYTKYKSKKHTYNNKEIHRRNVGNITTLDHRNNYLYDNNEYKYNKYDNIKNIIKENNNVKKNKYDYNKKLFDIYRGKLINEFFRLIEKAINKYLHKIFKFFVDLLLLNSKPNNKIDEIFIPKIYLEKLTNQKEESSSIRGSAHLKKDKYFKIFYLDKKFSQKPKFLVGKNKTNLSNLSQLNLDNKIYNNTNNTNNTNNNSFIINNSKKNNKIVKPNKIIKNEIIYNSKDKNKNNNANILKINRYSLLTNKNSSNHMNANNNNIQVIDINNSLNQYIYKKKIRLSKNITFMNKINKLSNTNNKEINKEDILSNSKGKIIDIDIDLGKPIKEINDISPLQNIFINDYHNKRYKTSLSTNKREKRKKKHRSKNKKLSLPKKKYVEEGYDSHLARNDEDDLDDISNTKRNNSYDNKLNSGINLNNSYNLNNKYFKQFINDNDYNYIDLDNENKNKKKNYKNILVKNIVTLDKRLFIHINYIFSLYSQNTLNINKKDKYDHDLLDIKRIIVFSIIVQTKHTKHKKKSLSNNSFFSGGNSRNNNTVFENENEKINKTNYIKDNKDKYLFSCVKFIIKNINKVFLKKAFRYFLSSIEEKYNDKKKKRNNKYKVNTYKKKISKGKV